MGCSHPTVPVSPRKRLSVSGAQQLVLPAGTSAEPHSLQAVAAGALENLPAGHGMHVSAELLKDPAGHKATQAWRRTTAVDIVIGKPVSEPGVQQLNSW